MTLKLEKKDPSQTLHTLVIVIGWLKLQTQLCSSARIYTFHLLCLHIYIPGSRHLSSYHYDTFFIFALQTKKLVLDPQQN